MIQDIEDQLNVDLHNSHKLVKGLVSPFPTFPNQGRIRHSDINIDGFDDLFMTLDVEIDGQRKKMSIILISEVCEEGLCHEKAVNRQIGEEPNPRRYFNGVEDKNSHLNLPIVEQLAGDKAVMIVPIDIDEDGRMDILV